MRTIRIRTLWTLVMMLVLAMGFGAGSAYAASEVSRVTGGGSLDSGERFGGSVQCRGSGCTAGDVHGAWFVETIDGHRFRATEFIALTVLIDGALVGDVTGFGTWDGDVVTFRIQALDYPEGTAYLRIVVLSFDGTVVIADIGGWVERGDVTVVRGSS